MFRGIIGAIVGIGFVYLCGALVAWDFNPGEWGGFWRLWCLCWAVLWAIIGAKFVYDVFTPKRRRISSRSDALRSMSLTQPYDKA
jgi:hypothetical protein